MRISTLALALVGTLGLTLAMGASAQAATARLAVSADYLAGPGEQYEVLGTFRAGARVNVVKCTAAANWCLVKRQDKEGWIAFSLITLSPGGAAGGFINGSDGSGGGDDGGNSGGPAYQAAPVDNSGPDYHVSSKPHESGK